jgi:hypothetical protein
MTFSIMIFNIMIVSIKGLFVTIRIKDTELNKSVLNHSNCT